jgi:hypothetical protein
MMQKEEFLISYKYKIKSDGAMKTLKKIGLLLIVLGVLVWPIGLFILHLKPTYCLVLHLSLVIPGAVLKHIKK